jgi:hypothetical protein
MLVSGNLPTWKYSTADKSKDLFLKIKNLHKSNIIEENSLSEYMNLSLLNSIDSDFALIITPDIYINSNVVDIFNKKYIENENTYAVSMNFRDLFADKVIQVPILWNLKILKNFHFKNEIDCVESIQSKLERGGYQVQNIDHIIGRIDFCSDEVLSYFYHKNLSLKNRLKHGFLSTKLGLSEYKKLFKQNKTRINYAAYLGYKDGLTEKNKSSANFDIFDKKFSVLLLDKINADLAE